MSKVKYKINKEELMKKHDFQYIRDHFFDLDYTKEDLVKDIRAVYEDNLDLSQLSATGRNTVRVTNYFVQKTQSKASSIRAKMSPYRAIHDDDALCQIFNRIDTHPRFFSIRKDTEDKLRRDGYLSYLDLNPDDYEGPFKASVIEIQKYCKEALNKADLREVRRALAHMPSFHKVSQFPNHVAQKVYERYAPIRGGVVLDSSCVDGETEYFDGDKWVKIKYYTEGDYVLQADFTDFGTTGKMKLELVQPDEFIHFANVAPFYEITTPRGHKMMLTVLHNVVYMEDNHIYKDCLFDLVHNETNLKIPYLLSIPDESKWSSVTPRFTAAFNFKNNLETVDPGLRDTEKYCFRVPSSNLVLRRNGFIFITGNCGWGNRLMASMSSKYHYKYLGTDPNSEMHPNYMGLAQLMYEALYKYNFETQDKEFPKDFLDIRDQGSEFDVPEWHNWSGYTEEQKAEILSRTHDIPGGGKVYEAHGYTHPADNGKGCADTGDYNTSGLSLPPILDTHNPDVYNSGVGDVSFTSPPYFFLECYTEESFNGGRKDGQSASKGDNYVRWVKDFMFPTIINHFNYLKPGAYYAYNLKDLPNDKMYLYADWLSVCLDVGFELVDQPVMELKARRQFGVKEDGTPKINFHGATERIAVLRKPDKPTDVALLPSNTQAIYHVQHNFNYPLISSCRPKGFKSSLPQEIEDWLRDVKFKDKTYKKLLK